MSRRDGNAFNLSEMIDTYKASKDKENALKKSNATLNENIKAYMNEHDLKTADSENYTATLTTTEKESVNETLAIEILKENLEGALLNSVIKKKEYIDEDALEKLVYNGDFDASKLERAKIVKKIQTLRIGKKK